MKKANTTNSNTPAATFTSFPKTDNWVKGTCGDNCTFEAKLYNEPSEYGINNGRVSKLQIKIGSTTIANFDRGWDIEPVKSEKYLFDAIMNLLENSPKRFGS